MNASGVNNSQSRKSSNQNIQVYVRVRPLNARERTIRSNEVVEVVSAREIEARHTIDSKLSKKFTFDRAFGPDSRQVDVYNAVVAPLIEEVLAGYNCTVFAYGQTGTGKTHTMVGNESATMASSWDNDSDIGIIPRALTQLFDELRMMEMEFSMRVSYLELYNEELCDLLSSDDSTKIRIFDDSNKKGSVIVQGLEEIPVNSKDDVYKLLEKGMERRKTAKTLMNAQSSRSHTVFSILVHIRETGIDNEVMLKIGKLNLVDLAGSENVSKAGNERGIRVRETVNINQSLLTLGRVITALVERTPHIPYRESKLTRLLQESLGGRTKTSIIATVSPGHKDIDETLSTLEYAHRAKNIQNKPEVNQKLTQRIVLKEYTEEIDKLKRDLMAAREKNGIYLADDTYNEMMLKMEAQTRELNEKVLLLKVLKDELQKKEQIFNEVSLSLVEKAETLRNSEQILKRTNNDLLQTKKTLDSTKRRYMEKKELLQHHVKTEEVLITQAKKILEVADVATKDTEQLHSILEQRRDIDRKIETASERLVSCLTENFDKMYRNLDELRKESDSYVAMTLEELNAATSQQNRLVEETNQKIADISTNGQQALRNVVDIQRKNSDTLLNMNQHSIEQVSGNCAQLTSQQEHFLQQLQEQLQNLVKNGELQQLSLQLMQQKAQALVQRQALAAKEHVQHLQQQILAAQSQFEKITGEITRIKETVNLEQVAETQVQKMVQKFVDDVSMLQQALLKDMQHLGGERKNNLVVISESSTRLIDNMQLCQQKMQQAAGAGVLFCEQHEQSGVQHQLHIEEHVTKLDQAVIKNRDTVEQMQQQAQLFGKQWQEEKNELKLKTQQQHEEAQKVLQQQLKKLEENVEEYQKQQSILEGSAEAFVETQSKNITEKHLVAGSLVKSIEQDVILPYVGKYEELYSSCLENVMDIKQTELKTYQSTGSTPNKREYRYPRVLAVTSPHEKIIEQFRQETDYADLEITTDISENSELERTDWSIKEGVGPEKVLNSTPIADATKRDDSSIAQGTVLSDASNMMSENTLQPSNTPNKQSTITTPLKTLRKINTPLTISDKENNI